MADTNKKYYVSKEKLAFYDEKIKGYIKDADDAILDSAKKYAEDLGVNYDTAGAAATAESNAKIYTDAEVAKANGAAATAQGAAEAAAAAAATADGKAVAAQADVDALEALVGTLPEGTTAKDVVDYVDIKTAGIATDAALGELQAQFNGLQSTVNTINGDYLKDADKTELEGKIALKADQTALDAVSAVANAAATQTALQGEINRAKGEEARIEGLVTAEATRAAGVEADFKQRIETMEVFWDTTEDKDGVVNKLKEIQDYIASDESGAATMAGNIQANTTAISNMDAAYKAADATLQGNIDTLAGVVNGKVAQGDFDTLSGKVTTAEGKITDIEGNIAALQGEDATIKGRLEAIDAKLGTGEGSVESKIATAKQEAIDAAASAADAKDSALEAKIKKYVDNADDVIEGTIATLQSVVDGKAAQADHEALASRVTTAEGEIDTLQSEMDAVEAKALANEGAISTINTELANKAADADLTAAKNRITVLETWHENFTEISEDDITSLFTK